MLWRFRTGGVIDAAAAIGAYDPSIRSVPITIGSGDERLYHLRSGRHPGRRVAWAFAPTLPPAATTARAVPSPSPDPAPVTSATAFANCTFSPDAEEAAGGLVRGAVQG